MAKFKIQLKESFDSLPQAEQALKDQFVKVGKFEVVEELEVIEVDPIREIIMYYLIWVIFFISVLTLSAIGGILIAFLKYKH